MGNNKQTRRGFLGSVHNVAKAMLVGSVGGAVLANVGRHEETEEEREVREARQRNVRHDVPHMHEPTREQREAVQNDPVARTVSGAVAGGATLGALAVTAEVVTKVPVPRMAPHGEADDWRNRLEQEKDWKRDTYGDDPDRRR